VGTDFVLLGLTKDWLLANEPLFLRDIKILLNGIRDARGFVIQAHPFKEAAWIDCIRLFPNCVDAVEVFNACCTDTMNNAAKAYAESYNLFQTAGSDIHHASQKILSGVETEQPCLTIRELIIAIIKRQTKPFTIIRNR
jgi:hypothetical protein